MTPYEWIGYCVAWGAVAWVGVWAVVMWSKFLDEMVSTAGQTRALLSYMRKRHPYSTTFNACGLKFWEYRPFIRGIRKRAREREEEEVVVELQKATLPDHEIRCSTRECPDKDGCKRWLVGLEEDWLGLHRYGELPVSKPGECDQMIPVGDQEAGQ